MAQYKNHITTSVVLGSAAAASSHLYLQLNPEATAIAFVVLIISGLLPDLDSKDQSGIPMRDLPGILALFPPAILITSVDLVNNASISRLLLLLLFSFYISKILIREIMTNFTKRRGMLHSIPAAVLVAEIAYLMFYDLSNFERAYISLCSFCGYFSHLFLDSMSRFDASGIELPYEVKKQGAAKLFAKSTLTTTITYALLATLAIFIAGDFSNTAQTLKGKILAPQTIGFNTTAAVLSEKRS